MMREGAKTHIGALSPVRARVSSSPLMSTNNKYYVVFRGRNHFANRSSFTKPLIYMIPTFNIMQLMRVRCMFHRIFGPDLPRFCDLPPPLYLRGGCKCI